MTWHDTLHSRVTPSTATRRSVRVRGAISERFGLTRLPQGDPEGLSEVDHHLLGYSRRVNKLPKMAGAAQPRLTITGRSPGSLHPATAGAYTWIGSRHGGVRSISAKPVGVPSWDSHDPPLRRAVTPVSRYLPFSLDRPKWLRGSADGLAWYYLERCPYWTCRSDSPSPPDTLVRSRWRPLVPRVFQSAPRIPFPSRIADKAPSDCHDHASECALSDDTSLNGIGSAARLWLPHSASCALPQPGAPRAIVV